MKEGETIVIFIKVYSQEIDRFIHESYNQNLVTSYCPSTLRATCNRYTLLVGVGAGSLARVTN